MLPKNYASTRNKERVRKEDTKLVEKEYLRKGRKLSYLGMPSGKMIDILAWEKYIGKCTAVEIDDERRRELVLSTMKHNLDGKIKILFGDIEKILIRGKDKFNNKLEFPYDIVFLDFFGTILYKQLQRVNAITCLIEKQKGHTFLLLLTFNLREKKYSQHTIKSVLDKIKKALSSFYIYDDSIKSHIQGIIDQYKSDTTHEMYRQKLFVPYFIKTASEGVGFKSHSYAPIFYVGFNDCPMIHFAFKLTSEIASPTHAISDQTIIDIINLNIKEASNERVFVKNQQMPRLEI